MTAPKLTVRFFRTLLDNEPVREWLKALPAAERKAIGEEIRTVQFGRPLGMPLVRKLDVDLWEVRVRLKDRIARVLFTIDASEAILLHPSSRSRRRSRTRNWRRQYNARSCSRVRRSGPHPQRNEIDQVRR